MKVSYLHDRKLITVTVIASLIYGILAHALGVGAVFSTVDALLFFAAVFLRFKVTKDLPWWAKYLMILCGAIVCFVFAQIICGAYYAMKPLLVILNLAFAYAVIAIIAGASKSIKAGIISMLVVFSALAAIDYLVVQARSYEIRFADLFSVMTALKVAGEYSYSFGAVSAGGLFALFPVIAIIIFNKFPRFTTPKSRIAASSTGAGLLVLSFVLVLVPVLSNFIGYQVKFWKYQSSSYNGFYLSLIKSVSERTIRMPEGYSVETLKDDLDGVLGSDSEKDITPDTSSKRPNVIVIMNETFSDLDAVSRALGYGIETEKDPLEYYHSLNSNRKNIIKGYAYASVYGGNTANSEFEFLTGNTMAFIDKMVVPFNNMIDETNAISLVELFNEYGYETVGMHPENRTNWNRSRNYELFGFNEQYFLRYDGTFVDQEKLTDEDRYRTHVSDETIYKKIITLFENKDEDTPLFTFAVTMQNHGGYYTENFDYEISAKQGNNTLLDEYLTSVSHSDAALKTLTDYFSAQEEDTVILFFGDHQPALNDAFYEKYMGLTPESPTGEMMYKYIVPYMIWANYDFEEKPDTAYTTSLNYLGKQLIETVGFEKTPYMKLLDHVRTNVRAINAFGWWDNDNVFHEIGDLSTIDYVRNYDKITKPDKALNGDEESVSALNLYYWTEYNLLKDDKNKLVGYYVLSSELYFGSRKQEKLED